MGEARENVSDYLQVVAQLILGAKDYKDPKGLEGMPLDREEKGVRLQGAGHIYGSITMKEFLPGCVAARP